MINFSTNSNTFNPLANLKISVKNADSQGTNSQSAINLKINSAINLHQNANSSILNSATNSSKNANSTQSKNSNSNEVLGYKVDKDGFFTAEFNEKAGIPSDYKIHSSTMQSLVKSQTTTQNFFYFANFQSVDIAKTIGNAYKIVSQLLEKSPELAHKESFSKEDLEDYFPRNYITDSSGNVLRTYTSSEAKEVLDLGGFKVGANEKLNLSFTTLRYTKGIVSDDEFAFDGDILHSNMFGGKEGLYSFDTTSDKYTNADSSITKGGLLVGFLSHNTFAYNAPSPLIAGQTSIQGKINALDKDTSQDEIKSLSSFMQSNILVLNSQNYGEFNQLMSSNLSIGEFKQAYLKLKQNTENRHKNEQNAQDFTDPKIQAMKTLLDELSKINKRLSKGDFTALKSQSFDEILANLNFDNFQKIDLKA